MSWGEAAFLEELTCIGQVAIVREPDGTYAMMHRDDRARSDLQVVVSAREIARYDDAGNYRALKTAPNLRHGWKMRAANAAEIARAIEELYPARLPAFEAFQRDDLPITPLRETLARQSGMYRVAARISDADLDQLVGNFCRSDGGCLRTILWKRDDAGTTPSRNLPVEKFDPAHDQTGRGEHPIPLLCQEACNLLVAAARAVVKGDA